MGSEMCIRDSSSACVLSHPQAAREQGAWLAARYPRALWVGVSLLRTGQDAQLLRALLDIAAGLGLRCVACGDVHMHEAGRRRIQDTLTAIRHRVALREAGQHVAGPLHQHRHAVRPCLGQGDREALLARRLHQHMSTCERSALRVVVDEPGDADVGRALDRMDLAPDEHQGEVVVVMPLVLGEVAGELGEIRADVVLGEDQDVVGGVRRAAAPDTTGFGLPDADAPCAADAPLGLAPTAT